ncbi:HAMP domain-containing sensor histidine kinase [Streptomyces sp. NPDC005395]|uniref:HAMP domain-containing sensor histidine kinase n=1 Tax=unclassified Streptomyces TaxID=2593676 RepID=UPI0021E3A359|nr:HAMP domain-containing sensor histidine kinase [Streptomyces sp. ICN988]MCV2460386.1 HAMP domain-containing sensor histidine kinase [Streptomyces sp. ICN988]
MGVVTDIRSRSRSAKLAAGVSCEQAGRSGNRNVSLFWRIFSLNAAGLVVATALLLGPVTVSTPVLAGEALVLLAGLVALLAGNAVVLRIGLTPLHRLGRAMSTADLLVPGTRPEVSGPAEAAQLIATYNTMLDRLQAERAAGAGRALEAQERERHRIARELHDEVGQTLTAVLLQLKRVADRVPGELREEVSLAQEATRAGLDEIRRIARRLRPGVLEELGLASALRSLATEFTHHGLTVQHHIPGDLPPLAPEAELVLYRVAQEGLTNTARHASADRAALTLRPLPDDAGVELLVRDNGTGLGTAAEGAGIRGMRERALLIGADIHFEPAPGGGTDVRLRVPAPPGDRSADRTGDSP